MAQLGGGGGTYERSQIANLLVSQQNLIPHDTKGPLLSMGRTRNSGTNDPINPYSNKQSDALTRSVEKHRSIPLDAAKSSAGSQFENVLASSAERKPLSKAAAMSSRAAIFSKRVQSSSRMRTISTEAAAVATRT